MDNEFIKNITEEGDNVMRILFICGNGVSSGMIASRTGKAGKAQGYDVDTEAYSYTELSEVIDDFDVVLAAPQMKCNEEMIRETCEEHGKNMRSLTIMHLPHWMEQNVSSLRKI